MDQYLFEFKINIVGCDLKDFFQCLEDGGFENQIEELNKQLKKELGNKIDEHVNK